jgi:hypothetical protein
MSFGLDIIPGHQIAVVLAEFERDADQGIAFFTVYRPRSSRATGAGSTGAGLLRAAWRSTTGPDSDGGAGAQQHARKLRRANFFAHSHSHVS